ncbi:hypothetical protein BDY19DRAFT_910713 [Irpex rosettiformis]|uniref:Uncharacterized protein n=1 Tax=Irpex rosettiformis TaxID=378272 RepID=A0ACB8TMV8_9APHY|nr:hypothetical protein BDY19DRAFT_910713 [Irpex rosettiformis]
MLVNVFYLSEWMVERIYELRSHIACVSYEMDGYRCAQNMSWLIAVRSGGALQSLASIIVSDLVPLRERGMYNSFIGLTWAFAAGVGPLIGGGLAVRGQWGWFFSIVSLNRGNIIFVGSSTSTAIALTWGGLTHQWSSAATLVPLIVGLCGLAFFLFYEEYFASHPIVPFKLLSNRTSLSGYLQTFLTPVVVIAWTYYFTTYWQSARGSSAIHAAVQSLAMTLVLGPVMILTGMGVFTIVKLDTPSSQPIGFSVLVGIGGGMLFSAQYFPDIRIGAALAFSAIPVISDLEEPLRTQVRDAFAESIRVIWQVMTGIAGLGLLTSLIMKGLPLHTQVDEKWGIEDRSAAASGGNSDMQMKETSTEERESVLPQL